MKSAPGPAFDEFHVIEHEGIVQTAAISQHGHGHEQNDGNSIQIVMHE